MEAIINRLNEIKKNGTLVSIYTNMDDPDVFWVGIVIALDGDYVLMRQFDDGGRSDGYSIRSINDIYMIIEDGEYLCRISRLRGRHNDRFIDMPDINENIFDEFVNYIISSCRFVSIELLRSGNSDICGQIVEYDSDVLKIRQFDQYGDVDGFAYVDKDAVSRIDFDSESERQVAYLAKCDNQDDN